jgi:hypothetical protein
MEILRRNVYVSPPSLVAGGDWPRARKRPSIGRAAENIQTKLIASFKSVRRRADDAQNRAR